MFYELVERRLFPDVLKDVYAKLSIALVVQRCDHHLCPRNAHDARAINAVRLRVIVVAAEEKARVAFPAILFGCDLFHPDLSHCRELYRLAELQLFPVESADAPIAGT